MQHTEKYKLNLIERDDTFSPDALNENMQKLEAAITAEADALDQRLQVFEAKHVAVGTYRPTTDLDIDLGFWPVCVIIMMMGSTYGYGMLFRDYYSSRAKITSNGFHIDSGGTSSPFGNSGYTYGYVAFD